MKNASVNSTLTPSGNLALAGQTLGLQEVPDSVRTSEGSLLASLLAAATPALIVFVTPASLVACTPGADTTTIIDTIGGSSPNIHVFTALEAATKARPLNYNGNPVVIGATIDGVAPSDPYISGVAVPAVPSYTALALVNKLVSIAEAEEDDYVIAVNQIDGTVSFFGGVGDDDLQALLVTNGSGVFAAFDLAEPSSGGGEEGESTVWE